MPRLRGQPGDDEEEHCDQLLEVARHGDDVQRRAEDHGQPHAQLGQRGRAADETTHELNQDDRESSGHHAADHRHGIHAQQSGSADQRGDHDQVHRPDLEPRVGEHVQPRGGGELVCRVREELGIRCVR